ncbi:MAG: DUF5131 family protein [Mariniphaga sp.]|nr:DUF5131 family protein [Paludibacter sp.]MDD4226002.1 DUF5131 family protein [Mariniphaga sp.]
MELNLVKPDSQMYQFITATFNTCKGKCYHDCSYCFCKAMAKRFNHPQQPVRFDEKEPKTNLGNGNYIFVGSSCDMFAKDIPDEWILKTLYHMDKFDNKYLLQTKNPDRVMDFIHYTVITSKCDVCTTIESDIFYPDIMGNSPTPQERSIAMNELSGVVDTYVTIEPIMQFDLNNMVKLIKSCHPKQVNLGADSGRNNLPEPSKEKVLRLIAALQKFTVIHNKTNLQRLLK